MIRKAEQLFQKPLYCYIAVFIISLVFYVSTCAPGVLWQDSGMIQYRVYNNDIEGRLGLALSHPLYYIIAIGFKNLPFGELAFKVNLVSAISGAFAVSNLFLLLRLWFGRLFAALTGALSLAVSHTFWQHSCMAETYVLFSALFLAGQIALLQYFKTGKVRWFYVLFCINGLAISVHMLASISFVCYVGFGAYLLFAKRLTGKNIFIAACLWLVCASPYLFLIISNIMSSGDPVSVLASAVFGYGYKKDVLNLALGKKIVIENIIFLLMNFPTPGLLLFFAGFKGLKKFSICRSQSVILTSLAGLFFMFAFKYTIADRYTFFIPFYVLVSVFIGLGAESVLTRRPVKPMYVLILLFASMPIAVYFAAPYTASKLYPSLGARRQIPYRDSYKYFLHPWKTHENGPERFALEALTQCRPDSIILADGTTVYALWYVQTIEGIRPDVKIVSKHGSYNGPVEYPEERNFDKLLSCGSVYVVSAVKGYCPAWLLDNYEFVREGVLYEVKGRLRKLNNDQSGNHSQ